MAMALSDFRGCHSGATVIVCGCGESLSALAHPERFVTIGVNDVGRLFDPTYLVVLNPPQQFRGDRFQYVAASRARYVFTQLANLPVASAPIVPIRLGSYGGTELGDGNALPHTQNSPYVAVCLAVFMGARRIGLIGVDFTENHFFAKTGRHPLAVRLEQIDREYARLAETCRQLGVEVFNLSPTSRLTAFPKLDVSALELKLDRVAAEHPLNIVSYATTPVAGVPALLARCINGTTKHTARCVWASGGYGNGVEFDGDVQWRCQSQQAVALLEKADLVIVHNGKVDAAHRKLLQSKPVVTMAHNYGWNVDMQFVQRGMPGVVVGQYQATLPEFAGWAVVPNPMPLWEEAFSPGDKGRDIGIAFTPSGRHECYPARHRLYWHSKGYATTMRVLDRLARHTGVRIESTLQGQVSHAQALAMKRRSHIVIDECVTGSYHRNSLEGLAVGCVVVNGVGLLPGVEAAFQQCAPEAGPLPFVFSTLERLEPMLLALIDQGPEALIARGKANREWIGRHWNFAEQWPRCWLPAVDAARVASPRRSATNEIPDVTKQEVPMRAVSSDKVSVIIPHGGSQRLPLLGATLASLSQSLAVGEVIVVEMGSVPLAKSLAARWGAQHLFIESHGAFERARALNAGTAIATYDLVAWHDNDLLHGPTFLARASNEMSKRGLDYMVPYSVVHYLSEPDAVAVRQGERAVADCRPTRIIRSTAWVGCIGMVRRQFVLRHGGLIEGFLGWGGEDDAWFHKVQLLGRSGATQLPDQPVFHLYHSLSGGLAPGKPGEANPHYAANLELLRRVRNARSANELSRCFPAQTPTTGLHAAPTVARPPDAKGLPVWTYWEGPCPPWIRACLRTLARHAPNLRLLGPETFEALRQGDPDRSMSLSHLHVAHRADYIRAFLLQRYGGLWIDADCVVMQPLGSVLELLGQYDFIAHRARQGVLSNAFIGAPPKSRIAAAYYERVRKVVAAKHRFSWNWLGGGLLTEVVTAHRTGFHELPCQRVQPICWSRPQDFLVERSAEEHDRAIDQETWTYMLSNVELGKRFPQASARDELLRERTFFTHLLRRSLSVPDVLDAITREVFAAEQVVTFRRHRCESVSGTGSTLKQTERLRQCLPLLLQHLGVRGLLDAPCGDRHWSQHLQLGAVEYVGVDVLRELTAAHAEGNTDGRKRFITADLLVDPLPRMDAILCRDLLPHLSFAEIVSVLRNFLGSGATWLLTTTFTGARPNSETRSGAWRTLNLNLPPFGFPAPQLLINEGCTEDGGRYKDKSLGVWRLADLPVDRLQGLADAAVRPLRVTRKQEEAADVNYESLFLSWGLR